MKNRTRIGAIAVTAAALAAGGAGAAFASGGDVPVATPTTLTTAAPFTTPAPTYFPPPVINPLRGCRFTTTDEFTFVPQLGRFNRAVVPSITCFSRLRGVTVYTLSR